MADQRDRNELERAAYGSRDDDERRAALEQLGRLDAGRPTSTAAEADAQPESSTDEDGAAPESRRPVVIGAVVALVALLVGALLGWRLTTFADTADAASSPAGTPSPSSTFARIDAAAMFADIADPAPLPIPFATMTEAWYSLGTTAGGDDADPATLYATVDAVNRPCLAVETRSALLGGVCASDPGFPTGGLVLSWQSGSVLATATFDENGVAVATKDARATTAGNADTGVSPDELPFLEPVGLGDTHHVGTWEAEGSGEHGDAWTARYDAGTCLLLGVVDGDTGTQSLLGYTCQVDTGADRDIRMRVTTPLGSTFEAHLDGQDHLGTSAVG